MKFLEHMIMAAMIVTMIFVGLATVNNLRAETADWTPSRAIELVIPVGCCAGGANDMARSIKIITDRHHMVTQNILTVNRPTGPASEGYVYVKKATADAHKITIAITSIFSHSIANPELGFHYTQLTPLALLALDDFVLWVPESAPFRTSREFLDHARQNADRVTMGGLGVKQEDQIVTAAIEQAQGVKFVYVPYKSGGEVAQQLAGGHIQASVNNPSEGLQFWRAGKIKPLCVFAEQRMPYRDIIAGGQSWNDVPTCREQGLDVTYRMMRAIFGAPGIDPKAKKYYQDLLRGVTTTAEWRQYVTQNALEPKFLINEEFDRWLRIEHGRHQQIMSRTGWIAR